MESNVYLDESGDLGWTFTAPYRSGGSSRFLTLGYLICPDCETSIPKRLVREIYNKYGFDPKKEKKATKLSVSQKEEVCKQVLVMLHKNPTFQLGAITVMKEKVSPHIRIDGNKLYNYMMKLGLLDKVDTSLVCKITRDNKSVKVASGNSCIDYLQLTMWFEYNSPTKLIDQPKHSHTDDGLIFIDWITNIVWSHFEDKVSSPFNILSPVIKNQTLFF